MISGNGKGYGSTQFETSVEQMDSICLSVFLSFPLSLSRVDYDSDSKVFSHTLLRQSLQHSEIEIKQQQNKKKK